MKLSDTIVIMHALKARQSTLRDYMHRCLQTTGPGERPYSIETEKEATLVQAAIEEAEEIAEELKRLRAKDAEHLEQPQGWMPAETVLPKMRPDYPTRSERVLVMWPDDRVEIAQLELYEDNTFRWVVQEIRGETIFRIEGTSWRLIPKR